MCVMADRLAGRSFANVLEQRAELEDFLESYHHRLQGVFSSLIGISPSQAVEQIGDSAKIALNKLYQLCKTVWNIKKLQDTENKACRLF